VRRPRTLEFDAWKRDAKQRGLLGDRRADLLILFAIIAATQVARLRALPDAEPT